VRSHFIDAPVLESFKPEKSSYLRKTALLASVRGSVAFKSDRLR